MSFIHRASNAVKLSAKVGILEWSLVCLLDVAPLHVLLSAKLEDTHALKNEFTEDAASIIVTRYDGQRFRWPKGDAALSDAPASRKPFVSD